MKQQFFKKLQSITDKTQEIVLKLQKDNTKDQAIKYNLKLLGYNTQCITILQNWKQLEFINNEKANKTIAHLIRRNNKIYNDLLLLKQ